MKKLLSTLLSISIIAGAVPMGAGAQSEQIKIEDAPESWSETVISGDVNTDGKLNIADAVILQRCLMGNYSPESDTEFDVLRLDINFDGSFDIFDMVQMRKFVINPDEAPTQEWVIDALEDDGFFEDEAVVVVTTQEEFIGYLSLLMKDVDISKYTEKYNRDFFKENNLILKLFRQERGNGVYYKITASGRVNYNNNDLNFNGICLFMDPQYEHDTALYPVTNIPVFVQVTIPKSQCCENEQVNCIDTSKNPCEEKVLSYISPDGETELCVTQSESLLDTGVDLCIKNPDGTLTPLTSFAKDNNGCCPFNDRGEWFTDDEGNSVFGDKENFTITWYDNGVIIDHKIDCDIWEKKGVTFDGEVTEYPTYSSNDTNQCGEPGECEPVECEPVECGQ